MTKLLEMTDQLERLRHQTYKAISFIDTGWSGMAADACRMKLEYFNQELVKTIAEMGEATRMLHIMGDEETVSGVL